MKARDLIDVLEQNPDMDIVISTEKYMENPYGGEYKRQKPEHTTAYTVDIGKNTIEIQSAHRTV